MNGLHHFDLCTTPIAKEIATDILRTFGEHGLATDAASTNALIACAVGEAVVKNFAKLLAAYRV